MRRQRTTIHVPRPTAVVTRVQRAARCTLCAGSEALVRRRPASMHALGSFGVGLGVLDLSVAQQLERSVQDLYEFEWAGGATDGPGAPPEHALSGASAPVCASCAQVR